MNGATPKGKAEIDGQPALVGVEKRRSTSAWLIGCFFISPFGQMTPISLPDRFQRTVDFHGTLGQPCLPSFDGKRFVCARTANAFSRGNKEFFGKGGSNSREAGNVESVESTARYGFTAFEREPGRGNATYWFSFLRAVRAAGLQFMGLGPDKNQDWHLANLCRQAYLGQVEVGTVSSWALTFRGEISTIVWKAIMSCPHQVSNIAAQVASALSNVRALSMDSVPQTDAPLSGSMSFVYPMFNEKDNIETAVRESLLIGPRLAREVEIVIVNDA